MMDVKRGLENPFISAVESCRSSAPANGPNVKRFGSPTVRGRPPKSTPPRACGRRRRCPHRDATGKTRELLHVPHPAGPYRVSAVMAEGAV